MRRAFWIPLVLWGCPESIDVGRADASDAAIADVAPDTGRPDAALDAGPDAGEVDAGAEDAGPGDTGLPDAGPRPPLSFAEMQVPNGQPSIRSIWGRSSDEIYAGTSNGNILRFTSAQGWQFLWHEPFNGDITRIRGGSNRLFITTRGRLWVHEAAPSDTSPNFLAGTSVRDLHVVDDDTVFLVGDLTNGRAVFEYDGVDLTIIKDDLDVGTLYGVYADQDRLFVTGNGKIFRRENFAWTEENIAWPAAFTPSEIASFQIHDIAAVGDRLFAVGDRHHVLELGVDTWTFVHEPMQPQRLITIAPLGLEEAYAVGRNVAGGPIVRFHDGLFQSAGWMQNHNFNDIWVANEDEVYIVGNVGSSLDPVILRGTR